MKHISPTLYLLLILLGCTVKPRDYSSTSVPQEPDYSSPEAWAALPDKSDAADLTPNDSLRDRQSEAAVDVFFLHPTTYTGRGEGWNASVQDEELNHKTDRTAIKYQATIFNGVGKVYAPRYRQAHLYTFLTDDQEKAEEVFEHAYGDLQKAFQYYLDHYNNNRPVIIAAHSQGARHAVRLLRDYFDGRPLRDKLVAAYIVGWPVRKKEFATIPPCRTPEQIGCFCSWRSFKKGYVDPLYLTGDSILVTNPLTWRTEGEYAPKSLHRGAVLRDFNKVYPDIADAQAHNGILWVNKPRFPGSLFFTRRNYHIADYNLFYVDVRENARLRKEAYFQENSSLEGQ